MNKQFALMKIKNLFLTLSDPIDADHIRYIYLQLQHDQITPADALKKVYQLLG